MAWIPCQPLTHPHRVIWASSPNILNHLYLTFLNLSTPEVTPTFSQISSFSILYFLVTPRIHLNILNFTTLIFWNMRVFNRPTLYPIKHSRPNHHFVEHTFKFRWASISSPSHQYDVWHYCWSPITLHWRPKILEMSRVSRLTSMPTSCVSSLNLHSKYCLSPNLQPRVNSTVILVNRYYVIWK